MDTEVREHEHVESGGSGVVVEVFADIICPFTHIGLRRFVEKRAELGRDDVRLRVRPWPLEIVNGKLPDPAFLAREMVGIREQVAPDLFGGFEPDAFPRSSIAALALAERAYGVDAATGEAVNLELRELLFERATDISSDEVLAGIASRHGIDDPGAGGAEADRELVEACRSEGAERGVVGSPHFFTAGGDFFCPALRIRRDDSGHLDIDVDESGFDRFLAACFG